MQKIIAIPVSKIKVGEHEQRLDKTDDAIEELAASMRKVGVLVPLIVKCSNDQYLLIAGHRRLQAAKMAGLSDVPVVCRACSAAEEIEVSFAENFFRKDLSPVELACAIKDAYVKAVLTVKELAAGFHRSEHWVQQMMAVADWPVDVLAAVHNENISVSAAANLAIVTDDTYRRFLVSNAVESGATARTTASWLQAWRAMQPQEEAITAEPVKGQHIQTAAVPQAPCICCSQMFAVNEMSHVPVCGACVQLIRQIGVT